MVDGATCTVVSGVLKVHIGASQWDGLTTELGTQTANAALDEMRATIAALTARIAALESRA